MALIEEALLGAPLGGLIQAIYVAKHNATSFRKTLEHLESTLKSVGPIMEQLIRSGNVNSDVCCRFVQQLKNATILIGMYSDIKKWKWLKKRKVKKLIQEMDASLQQFLTQDFQVEQLRYLGIIDKDVTEMNKKMDHIIKLLEGKSDIAIPEPATDEILSSPENSASDGKQSRFAFEFHWKNKDKCLDIRFWRQAHNK